MVVTGKRTQRILRRISEPNHACYTISYIHEYRTNSYSLLSLGRGFICQTLRLANVVRV